MFPSLVNCTTINWFTAWPDEALRSVASFVLSGADIPGPVDIKETIIDVFTDMQQRVTALSQRLLTEMKRHYYVTPTSYLELLNTFQALLGARRSQLDGARVRYENGISKLLSTEEQVATMQAELVALQPKLAQASTETEAMIANIQVVSAEVAQKAEVVAVEEAVCKEKAAAAKAIKDDCEAQLAEAIPILEAAVAALNNLKKSDIVEVKSMKAPPAGVKLTMEAVCIMFKLAPKKVSHAVPCVRAHRRTGVGHCSTRSSQRHTSVPRSRPLTAGLQGRLLGDRRQGAAKRLAPRGQAEEV